MRRNRVIRKAFIYTLIGAIVAGNITPAYAYTYTDSKGNVETQEVTEADSYGCEVYAELGSKFIVTIPKKITLDGSLKTGKYTVDVEGDIAGNEYIAVTPDESFTLSSTNLASVTALISQDKKDWTYDEILAGSKVAGNGAIDASGISAGAWKGTFNFNVKLAEQRFDITAVDESGTNLNATGAYIVGSQKSTLINELIESGLIEDKDEVATLIDVQSNEFNGNAITTFDVSNIAKAGDIVTFYHYDETNGWEYIGMAVVSEEGTATGTFNSFSPVAISVEKSEDHVHSYNAGVVTKEATCTEDGVKTFTCICGDSYTEAIPAGHKPVNGYCTVCGEKVAGLYDANGVMLCSWEDSGIDVETNYSSTSSDENYYQTSTTSPYYVLTNNYSTVTKVVIPDSVTSIGSNAFAGCTNLVSIDIPDSVTSIRSQAFYGCTGEVIINCNIPNVSSCSDSAFYKSKFTKVTIGEGVTSIGDYAFYDCTGLTSVTIGSGVTSIGNSAFQRCTSLKDITIPDGVTSIGNNAFGGCTGLTSVIIPNSVTSIND